MSLYPSVDENGFHGEIQILAPNDDWKNYAQQMTTGRFSGNARQDDIVIRWKDGEVSQFTDVSERGMGTETQAIAPNDTWIHADEIASGDYTGNDNWDLIIRWSDGELTNYQDFTGNVGAVKENQLVAPNETWNHATILSGGDYSDNPWPDDTVVRVLPHPRHPTRPQAGSPHSAPGAALPRGAPPGPTGLLLGGVRVA